MLRASLTAVLGMREEQDHFLGVFSWREWPWTWCPHPTLREDIAYRLPELDPRGSDEENLDSETSASTESLLEERGVRGAVEGQCESGILQPSQLWQAQGGSPPTPPLQ